MNTIEKILHLISTSDKGDYTLDREIGFTRGTITNWRAGKAKPSADALAKIADYFDVSVDYLLGRTDERALGLNSSSNRVFYDANGSSRPAPTTDHSRWVPVYGAIAAGVPIEAIENIEDWEEIDTNRISGDIIGLRVKGHSMEPRICDGDVVMIHLQPTVENGDIAAVMVNGDEATLKKVKVDTQGILLIPLNPSYDTMFYTNQDIEEKPVRIIGKMIELRGKF